MTDALADLLARLEAATGPDREVDMRVHVALRHPGWTFDANDGAGARCFDEGRKVRHIATEAIPDYTASFDASLALTERVLPGWHWGVHCHKGAFRAHVTKPSPLRPMPNIGDAPTPARALLAALLRAKMEASRD